MTRLSAEQREIISLLVAEADGRTTDEDCARMEQLVKGDDDLVLFLVQVLGQEAWLVLHGLQSAGNEQRVELAAQIGQLLNDAELSTLAGSNAECHEVMNRRGRTLPGRLHRARAAMNRRLDSLELRRFNERVLPVAGALLALGIGIIIGSVLNLRWATQGVPAAVTADTGRDDSVSQQPGVVLANYEAHLMQSTPCVWGSDMRRRPSGNDSLRSGDSLSLVQGLAELTLSWPNRGSAAIRLEGPAGLVLMSDDGVNLNYGKLTANVELNYDRFVVETPLGRIEVFSDARIGVAASPNSVEIHVFRGAARVVRGWPADSKVSDEMDVRAHHSIRWTATEAGTVAVTRGTAMPNYFASQVSMTEDLLGISDKYIATIKAAAPVCYWRFNTPTKGVIHNEMADRYHGHVLGRPEWVEEQGNTTMQCGAWLAPGVSPSHVVADSTFEDRNLQDYSLELWVKPSHYHTGTMAALLTPPGVPSKLATLHGALLELGGPWSVRTDLEHPACVRFLHRNPPDQVGGTSCFSSSPYSLRKWQHIVAVKEGADMRMFIDGKVVAEAQDATSLPDGLELLIGQLDRVRDSRPFIGQIDEVAFYNRALSDQEIQRHFFLVRPRPLSHEGI